MNKRFPAPGVSSQCDIYVNAYPFPIISNLKQHCHLSVVTNT
ncbi:unnamed protein product [Tenebrio molitor]|nr:unnamed protein product [Tenebrio molitor]